MVSFKQVFISSRDVAHIRNTQCDQFCRLSKAPIAFQEIPYHTG